MKIFTTNFLLVKKVLCSVLLNMLFLINASAQSNQAKAEQIVSEYLSKNTQTKSFGQNIQFKPIAILRSPFEETKTYKNLIHKVDSLKLEGKRIDARIAKMKTTAELNRAKADSYRLSGELTSSSETLIDFMTGYKGPQTGWLLKANNRVKSKRGNSISNTKTFYLNRELTRVDSAR